jgi:hypothetical protein
MGEKKTIPERVIELENQVAWLLEQQNQNAKDIMECRRKIAQLIDANNELVKGLTGVPDDKKPGIITLH